MSIPQVPAYPLPPAAALPENRVHWHPDPARAVLLIHDLQQYFLDFYAAGAEPLASLAGNIAALRDAADAAGVPVIYTAQPPQQSLGERGLLQDWWGPGITARPERAPIWPPLTPKPEHTVLTKWRYSAFARTDLAERLAAAGRDQLVVVGVYAHIGCLMTVADAFMRDVQAFLVADAVADFSAERHAMALDYVAQRCGVVLPSAAVLAAWAGPVATLPDNATALLAEVAVLLELPVSDLMADDNLLDLGLDSIRLMTLVERWRRAGVELAFVDLAERPTVAAWWTLLAAARRQ